MLSVGDTGFEPMPPAMLAQLDFKYGRCRDRTCDLFDLPR